MAAGARRFPSPDEQKAELHVRTQLGRIVTELFDQWDDPYRAPEANREAGQAAIVRMVEVVERAAIARGFITPEMIAAAKAQEREVAEVPPLDGLSIEESPD